MDSYRDQLVAAVKSTEAELSKRKKRLSDYDAGQARKAKEAAAARCCIVGEAVLKLIAAGPKERWAVVTLHRLDQAVTAPASRRKLAADGVEVVARAFASAKPAAGPPAAAGAPAAGGGGGVTAPIPRDVAGLAAAAQREIEAGRLMRHRARQICVGRVFACGAQPLPVGLDDLRELWSGDDAVLFTPDYLAVQGWSVLPSGKVVGPSTAPAPDTPVLLEAADALATPGPGGAVAPGRLLRGRRAPASRGRGAARPPGRPTALPR